MIKLRHIAPASLILVALACSKEQPAPESPEGSESAPADAPRETDPASEPPPPAQPEPGGPAGQAPAPTPMQKQGPDERLQHGGGSGGVGAMGGMGGTIGIGGAGKSPIRKG
jgi:hypothetical protein